MKTTNAQPQQTVSPLAPSFPRRNKDPAYLQRSVWKGGSDGKYGPDWIKMWDKNTESDTNPLGIIVPDELKKEIRLYADLNQVTKDVYSKQNNTGTMEGLPTILSPNELLNRPETPMWLIPEDSGVYDYTIPDDDIFYIMATSGIYANQSGAFDDLTTNWIGYVAISNGDKDGKNRDIAIVFRGTVEESEWWSDFQPEMVRWNDLEEGEPGRFMLLGYGLPLLKRFNPGQTDAVMVAKGFEQMYRHFTSTPGNSISVQGQIHVALHKLLAAYPGKVGSITTTGHSLGGALASMCAFDIATSRINRDGDGAPVVADKHRLGYNPNAYIPVTAITFEAPRVGNENYAKFFDAPKPVGGPDVMAGWADLKMLRIVNKPDIVPTKPDEVTSIVERLFDPLHWGQLAVHLVYEGAIYLAFHKYWEITNIYTHGGVEYQVDSLPLEGKNKPLPTLSGLDEVFQHHNMQVAVYLCDPSSRGPFTPCDLKDAKDGPKCRKAARTRNAAALAH